MNQYLRVEVGKRREISFSTLLDEPGKGTAKDPKPSKTKGCYARGKYSPAPIKGSSRIKGKHLIWVTSWVTAWFDSEKSGVFFRKTRQWDSLSNNSMSNFNVETRSSTLRTRLETTQKENPASSRQTRRKMMTRCSRTATKTRTNTTNLAEPQTQHSSDRSPCGDSTFTLEGLTKSRMSTEMRKRTLVGFSYIPMTVMMMQIPCIPIC